jgi:nicotinamidase-related amidase
MTLTAVDPVAALVVIDLQEGLRAAPTVPSPPDDIVARTAALARAFRDRGSPVLLVRVTVDGAGFSPGRTDAGRRGTGTRPEGWDEVVAELADLGDSVITKRNPGAFVGTDLDVQLRRRGVTQVVLTGISTSMGVESTARAAFDLGYHVVLVTDAVGDLDEASHRHVVERVFPRIGETTTTDEALAMLGLPSGR